MVRKILYQDISDDLKTKIFQGVYPIGTLIPTEVELEESYGVSKITIRNAINLLVNEGYLEKQSGKGTTVISNRLFNKLSTAESFTSILENQGVKLEKHIYSVEELNPEEVDIKFEISNMTHCVTKIIKVYTFNGVPYILFNHYLPFKISDSLVKKLELDSLYQVIKEIGEIASNFDDTFNGHLMTEVERDILKTNETLSVERTRKSYNKLGQLIEYSVAIYNTQVAPYEIKYEI